MCACLGVAVDGGTEAGLLEADVALDPPELRLLRHAAPARRHAFLWLRVRGTRQEALYGFKHEEVARKF